MSSELNVSGIPTRGLPCSSVIRYQSTERTHLDGRIAILVKRQKEEEKEGSPHLSGDGGREFKLVRRERGGG